MHPISPKLHLRFSLLHLYHCILFPLSEDSGRDTRKPREERRQRKFVLRQMNPLQHHMKKVCLWWQLQLITAGSAVSQLQQRHQMNLWQNAILVTSQWRCPVLGSVSWISCFILKVTLLWFQVTCPSSCVPGLTSSLIPDCFHLCSLPPCV